MKKLSTKKSALIKILIRSLVNLPTPTSISYIWNWGSLLGIILGVQLLTGLILASYYNPRVNLAFNSVIHIIRDIDQGFIIRFIHINGARIFFILIFSHIRRGLIFSSFKLKTTWLSGVIIIFILIGTAFLGYVLPWGQISFWGATVITNLISAIPYLGGLLVQWFWGGFSIGIATLRRFYILHFLLPFLLRFLVIIHLVFLHETGSNNPITSIPHLDKTPFHPYFTSKDSITAIVILITLLYLSLFNPNILGDAENYNPANPISTPKHIQPEWYFLFAYAILRSIPNKLGGVVALVISIVSLAFLPLFKKTIPSKKVSPLPKLWFWVFSTSFLILTWIGACPVEPPFEQIGKAFSIIYFSILLML